MRALCSKLLAAVVIAAVAVSAAEAATKRKKPRAQRDLGPQLMRDYDGTPIIMQGYRRPRIVVRDEQPKPGPKPDMERPVRRGSSTYIPPPVPSPSGGPPAPPPLQSAPTVYRPPPVNSFGDRVTNCIHSFPLAGGLGNNPTNQQAYIRQCAN